MMKFKQALAALTVGLVCMAGSAQAQVSYEQVRNATGKVIYNDTVFLIDPLLADKGTYPGFPGSFNSEVFNPTVELPYAKEDVIKGVDAVVVTHTHLDHWDDVAQQIIPKDMPLFVQDEMDAAFVKKAGFTNVNILSSSAVFNGVKLTKVECTHGTEEMFEHPVLGPLLGDSMGVIFSAEGEKTVYLAGDTIWTARISKTLNNVKPDVMIMNTGYAKTLGYNESIIMGTEDVLHAAKLAPYAKLVTVHMDAINHCTVSRQNMRDAVAMAGIQAQVAIPEDGEIIKF